MSDPVLTISGLGVRVGGQLTPDLNLELEQHVDATADDATLNDILDRMTRAFWRQQAHPRLIEALVDLKARQDTISTLPQRLADHHKDEAAEAMRIRTSYEAQHQAAMLGKRNQAQFVDWPKHAEMIEKLRLHEENGKTKRAEMEAEAAKYKAELPLVEKRIARQRAILAGTDRADTILDGELPAAAE